MPNLPNSITLARIALVVVFTIAISITPEYPIGYPFALFTFAVAALSDWLDGYLARKLHLVTTFGKLIDPLADKIAVSAAFIYLTAVQLCPIWVCILIISREFLVTGIRQIAQENGIIIAADNSGKWKTAFQLAFCLAGLLFMTTEHMGGPSWALVISEWWNPSGTIPVLYHVTLWGSVALTVWSGLFYCYGSRKFIFR